MLLGKLFLGLGFVTSIIAVAALALGHKLGEKEGEGVTNIGYYATFAGAVSFTVSVLTLVVAFFQENFTFLYVAENHSTDVSGLAWLYKLSGLWAGREGSLLFWTWLIALFACYVAYKRMEITDKLSNMGLMVTNIVLGLFGMAMLFAEVNDPFKATPATMLGANGELLSTVAMNPLLQHWAMILHPPTLFIGYAGLTLAFAFAMASLIVNDSSKKWIEIVDRITVFSWLFLGTGIGLGAIWAYVVLGWGGYWAWDPVENASLLPWLTGVGLIHSFTVYRRRDGFKRWAIVNSAVTFSLVVLGTFITRSGIVQSVHAFQPDSFSTWLFGFMIIAPLIAAGVGLWLRGKSFDGNDEFESLTAREAAYYFNNLLMLVAAVLVAYMTVTSALPSWMPFGGQSIGAGSYDLLARPIGVLYAFILAVCPLLSWKKTEGADFMKRAMKPLITAAVIFAALLAEWWVNLRPIYDTMVAQGGTTAEGFTRFGSPVVYHGIAILGFLAGSIIISTTVWMFIDGASKRAKARGESWIVSFGNNVFKARTQSGGYLAHIGIGIILIGLVGSAMYVQDVKILLDDQPGQSFKVSNYSFTYKNSASNDLPNGDVVWTATFDVRRDGKSIGTVTPGQTQFARQGQTRLNASVRSEVLRDIFMVWEGVQDGANGQQLSLNVKINPLIWFAWSGFAILLLGAALAAWPKKAQPELRAVPARKAR
ncbi:MAG TPA: cytochrome c biogenesis protein CcsA [Coriobacteriia bacterium]|nr:cytochrome c biogenesis protein CcsA [Coriobacteriia bacterium]